MCYALYLITAKTVPIWEWREEELRFYVQPASREAEAGLRARYRPRQVYYAGSWLGCGCGFTAGITPPLLDRMDEQAQRERSMQSRRDLIAFARAQQLDDLRLLCVWDGEQDQPVEAVRSLALAKIATWAFEFEINTEYRLYLKQLPPGL